MRRRDRRDIMFRWDAVGACAHRPCDDRSRLESVGDVDPPKKLLALAPSAALLHGRLPKPKQLTSTGRLLREMSSRAIIIALYYLANWTGLDGHWTPHDTALGGEVSVRDLHKFSTTHACVTDS